MSVAGSTARRILRSRSRFGVRAAATYGTSVTVSLLSLANVLVISRTLGATGRGQVAFVTTVAYLTAQFASLGLQQANSNIGGAEERSRPALATNSVVFSFALGLLGIGVVVTLIAFVPAAGAGSAIAPRWLALSSIPPVILGGYLQSLVQADYRFAAANVAGLLTPVLILAVNGGLAAAGRLTVTASVAAWAGGQLASTVLVAWYVAVRADGFGRFDRRLGRRMFGFGLKTHLGRVLNFGNYRLDQWLVGSIAGARALGLYSVAVAWSEGLFFLPTAVAAVQRPDLVRATPEVAYKRAARTHRIAQIVTAVLCLGLVVLARPLTVGVFGSDFRGSVTELRILALGGFGIVTLKQLGDALTAQRKPLLESLAIGAAFVSTIVLDVILIPRHGGLGAAVASTAAYTVGGAAVMLIFRRARAAAAASSRRRNEAFE